MLFKFNLIEQMAKTKARTTAGGKELVQILDINLIITLVNAFVVMALICWYAISPTVSYIGLVSLMISIALILAKLWETFC